MLSHLFSMITIFAGLVAFLAPARDASAHCDECVVFHDPRSQVALLFPRSWTVMPPALRDGVLALRNGDMDFTLIVKQLGADRDETKMQMKILALEAQDLAAEEARLTEGIVSSVTGVKARTTRIDGKPVRIVELAYKLKPPNAPSNRREIRIYAVHSGRILIMALGSNAAEWEMSPEETFHPILESLRFLE